MEEKDFEPAGLIPRSIVRTVERFQQQLRPETVALGIQEFRISRYQVRVSVRYLFILLLLPLFLNWAAKNVIIKPLVGYFWNTNRESLFLNSYQADRAFQEMRDFESQVFFEMLLSDNGDQEQFSNTNKGLDTVQLHTNVQQNIAQNHSSLASLASPEVTTTNGPFMHSQKAEVSNSQNSFFTLSASEDLTKFCLLRGRSVSESLMVLKQEQDKHCRRFAVPSDSSEFLNLSSEFLQLGSFPTPSFVKLPLIQGLAVPNTDEVKQENQAGENFSEKVSTIANPIINLENKKKLPVVNTEAFLVANNQDNCFFENDSQLQQLKSGSLFQTTETCFAKLFQKKTVLLAEIYNQQSITALSNMFGDCVMIVSTVLLLRWNAPQFTILKSFLIESFYSFNDAIKCFYIILITDFLVGFHSPRGWEVAMEMLLRHLGLPENEEFILLFVGTFPVFLDTAFKYWIFRYLNKISPSTVATYHSMIE